MIEDEVKIFSLTNKTSILKVFIINNIGSIKKAILSILLPYNLKLKSKLSILAKNTLNELTIKINSSTINNAFKILHKILLTFTTFCIL